MRLEGVCGNTAPIFLGGNCMSSKEAIEALMAGKKVRCTEWVKDAYVYYDQESLTVKDNNDNIQMFTCFNEYFSNNQWELYEEPKKLIKVFISQPMRGRCKCEITEERNKIKKLIEAKYSEGYQIEYLNEDLWERPKDWTRIQHLGYSIMNMHDADIVVFGNNWDNACGCIAEQNVAVLYSKCRIYIGDLIDIDE